MMQIIFSFEIDEMRLWKELFQFFYNFESWKEKITYHLKDVIT